MFRVFTNEADAHKHAHRIKRETHLQIVVLHRVFGNEHKYVVGRYVQKGARRRFIAYS